MQAYDIMISQVYKGDCSYLGRNRGDVIRHVFKPAIY
jgi:hypothetical protein